MMIELDFADVRMMMGFLNTLIMIKIKLYRDETQVGLTTYQVPINRDKEEEEEEEDLFRRNIQKLHDQLSKT